MSRSTWAAVTAATLGAALVAGPVFAQRPGGPPPGGGRPGGPGQRMTPDQVLDQMAKRLNLTAAQKAKLKPMMDQQQKQMMAVFQDQSTPRDQKFQKIQQMNTAFQAKVKKLLTPDQQKKYEQMQQEMRQRFQRGGPGGPGGRPGGPGGPGGPPR